MISTASETSFSGGTHMGWRVITSLTRVSWGLSALASTRVIRSRSVTMPSRALCASMMSTLPQLARVMTQAASQTLACGPRLMTCRCDMDWKTVRSGMMRSPCVAMVEYAAT